jgi:hypothetical protein
MNPATPTTTHGVPTMSDRYERESSISRERAREILESLGMGGEYDPAGDYYVSTDADGGEHLTLWGQDEPLATNTGTRSWLP